MDRENQTRIIEEMCKGLREAMLAKLPRVPEEWDGMELRALFADTARENFTSGRRDNRLGMWRDYANTRAVNNL
jgi:hypothetical protein